MNKSNRTVQSITPPPAFRVFVSSTYTDMLPYRDAIQTALNKADCIAYGMERFAAQAIPPIDACYNELAASQIYICALGMRYGSVDEETKKSFTQLEFEKARELGLPTLVFIIDEEKVSFKLNEIEMGEGGEKLKEFKKSIKNSKEVTCDFFDSPMSLQDAVFRSVMTEKKRQGQKDTNVVQAEDYVKGANAFRNFVRRPARYKGKIMTLRVRMDGTYGGWKIKDEIFKVFKMNPGDALYLNNIWVLGRDAIDVDSDIWGLDCFAQGDAADWLDSNEVTTGTVFEGRFMAAYEKVPKIASRGDDEVDAWIAKLILLEGIRVVERDISPQPDLHIDREEPLALLSQILSRT